MKTFYKNWKYNKLILLSLLPIFIIVAMVQVISFDVELIIIMLSLLLIMLAGYFLVAKKFSLSKIYLSETGIEWKLFEKKLKALLWSEIVEIREYKRNRENSPFSIMLVIKNGDFLLFNANNEIKKTILDLCPMDELKKQLEKIVFTY